MRERSRSSSFTHLSTSNGSLSAFSACSWVSWLMLYGYFTLFNKAMMSVEAKAMPSLMAAQPHAFDSVLSTMRLGCLASSVRSGCCEEKSL